MSDAAVLYVEDAAPDVVLLRLAWERAGLSNPIHVLTDGQAAMDYLAGVAPYNDRTAYPMPSLVLLDLNIPKVPGLNLLRWIRGRDSTRTLRVVVFSISNRPFELEQARELGANAYWVKPADPQRFDEMIASLRRLWLDEPPPTVTPGHVKLTTRMTIELPGDLAQRLEALALREQKNAEVLLLEVLRRELT